MKALEITNLKKTYANGVQALKDVSFSVEQGDFFALLGPNGAGKSTTIGVITSLVNKTSGSVLINGIDIDKDFSHAKSYLGVVPQEFNFDVFLKTYDVLIMQAGYYGVPRRLAKQRAEKYLRKLGLWEKRNAMARSLSGGMKRRLMIARALIHEPRILILDEPTAGVDIEIRRSMWRFLTELNESGVTIILTTHYLEEAESLCRNITIIDHGQVIESATKETLLKQLDCESYILDFKEAYFELPDLPDYKVLPLSESSVEVEVKKASGISPLIVTLQQHGIEVASLRNKTNRLEELFLRLTHHEEVA